MIQGLIAGVPVYWGWRLLRIRNCRASTGTHWSSGVSLAILMFVTEPVHMPTVRHKLYGNRMYSKRLRTEAERDQLAREGDKTIVFELQGSLYFGTTDHLFRDLITE